MRRRVDTDTASKIEKHLTKKNLEGVYLVSYQACLSLWQRWRSDLGCKRRQRGASGLEYYYNDILAGTNGHMIVETGAGGTPIAGKHFKYY